MDSAQPQLCVSVYHSALLPSNTLEAETRDLEDAAARRGWHVFDRYTDKYRATDPEPLQRPALERLFTDASDQRFTAVLVPRLSSLADTLPTCLGVLQRLATLGLGLVALEDHLDTTRSDSSFAALVTALSRLEARTATAAGDRVRDGLRQARARGTRLGRPPMSQAVKEHIIESWQRTASMRRTSLELKIPYSSVHAVVSAHRQRHPEQRSIRLELWMRVENNNKFVRGKGRSKLEIERRVLSQFNPHQPDPDRGVYHLTMTYSSDEHLERQIGELLRELWSIADMRNGFVEADLVEIGGQERRWS